jgi:hypothetical protein
MNTQDKIKKIKQDKDFLKLKKKVLKAYPGAHVRMMPDGYYEICTANGYPIRKPELYLPENKTVREAWERASYAIWFDGMVTKSFNAFSDERMARKFEKIKEEEPKYAED